MIKRIITILIILIVLKLSYKTYQHHILNPTDFKVKQYFFLHGEDFTDARINVVACVADYDTDKMMQKIRRYYNMLYGEADSLHITLFNSEDNFLNYDECTKQTFYKYSLVKVFLSG
ncbi:MAG: hypothetical protein IJZ44_08605 [Lachnospiraceae bacterium]|nr:hypothetical protein [Lachnospiraceae bacterium]